MNVRRTYIRTQSRRLSKRAVRPTLERSIGVYLTAVHFVIHLGIFFVLLRRRGHLQFEKKGQRRLLGCSRFNQHFENGLFL